MIVRCEKKDCNRVYDDAENSTICPHEPLPPGGVIVYSQGENGLTVREELYGRKNIDSRIHKK